MWWAFKLTTMKNNLFLAVLTAFTIWTFTTDIAELWAIGIFLSLVLSIAWLSVTDEISIKTSSITKYAGIFMILIFPYIQGRSQYNTAVHMINICADGSDRSIQEVLDTFGFDHVEAYAEPNTADYYKAGIKSLI